MTDRREAILTRLFGLLGDIEGVASVARNRDDAGEAKLPAAFVLDADEQADDAAHGRGRPSFAPNRVALTPEIYIVLSAPRDEVGTALSMLRAPIIKTILMDGELRGLCADGDIRYEGCVTGFARGRSFQGEMMLGFTFTYILNPQEL